jgi:hypothetical protein
LLLFSAEKIDEKKRLSMNTQNKNGLDKINKSRIIGKMPGTRNNAVLIKNKGAIDRINRGKNKG